MVPSYIDWKSIEDIDEGKYKEEFHIGREYSELVRPNRYSTVLWNNKIFQMGVPQKSTIKEQVKRVINSIVYP